jgi:Domain of unknown function (DUF4190)
MSSSGPGDEQEPPQWQQPQWQQPQQGDPLGHQSQQGGPSWQQPQDQPSWQQQQPQWGQQQQQWQQGPSTPGSATAALILGICALVICPLICGPLAIVYGNRAKREIDTSNGNLTGGGLATAGIVLGWIGVAFAVLGILFVIAAVAGSS